VVWDHDHDGPWWSVLLANTRRMPSSSSLDACVPCKPKLQFGISSLSFLACQFSLSFFASLFDGIYSLEKDQNNVGKGKATCGCKCSDR
jgi:hypothetical protein